MHVDSQRQRIQWKDESGLKKMRDEKKILNFLYTYYIDRKKKQIQIIYYGVPEVPIDYNNE